MVVYVCEFCIYLREMMANISSNINMRSSYFNILGVCTFFIYFDYFFFSHLFMKFGHMAQKNVTVKRTNVYTNFIYIFPIFPKFGNAWFKEKKYPC